MNSPTQPRMRFASRWLTKFAMGSSLLLACLIPVAKAPAQDVFTPDGYGGGYSGEYTPVQSSFEAWQRSDARRLAQAQDQLYWNDTYRDQLIWQARWYEYHRPFYRVMPNPWVPRFDPRVDQPIGREEVQTGPNRWESRPVYAEPAQPASPPVIVPRLDPRLDPQSQPETLPPVREPFAEPRRERRGVEF